MPLCVILPGMASGMGCGGNGESWFPLKAVPMPKPAICPLHKSRMQETLKMWPSRLPTGSTIRTSKTRAGSMRDMSCSPKAQDPGTTSPVPEGSHRAILIVAMKHKKILFGKQHHLKIELHTFQPVFFLHFGSADQGKSQGSDKLP